MATLDLALGSISRKGARTKSRLEGSKLGFNGMNPNGGSTGVAIPSSGKGSVESTGSKWRNFARLNKNLVNYVSKDKNNANTTFINIQMWDSMEIPRRESSSEEEDVSSSVLPEIQSVDGAETTNEGSTSNNVQPPVNGENGAVVGETGSTSTGTGGGTAAESLQEIHRVTVVMLGARGVGKSSLARQFVYSEFKDDYCPTKSRAFFYISAVVNERIYEVKLVDCSSVVRFPVNSIHEWNEQRGCCLRNATAYLLVYDVSDDESFRYVRSMREQIVRSRDVRDVPIFIAANKLDLVPQALAAVSGAHGTYGASVAADLAHRAAKNREAQSNTVRKQWKCGYVECSAKYNWHVTSAFRELMRAVDHSDQHGHRVNSNRVQNALHIERCVIL